MFIRILLITMCLPLMFAAPEKVQDKKYICIEAFQLKDGKIYVYKSEIIFPQSYQEALLQKNAIRRKRVWIEIYRATPFGIKLYAVVSGKVIPAVPEHYDFEGVDKNLFKKEQP